MDESQLIKALDRDDSYRVIRTLATTEVGRTELVRGPGADLLVRKYVPRELANERAWKKLREISHPLLPQVRDLYWLPDSFVVVTTYVDGITLNELVGTTGPLEPEEAIGYLQDLCDAAGELHDHGIVHRDITPSNAVVAGGHAALIDLGNAHAHVEGADRDTTTLGTWGFAAPEQFGFAQTDARSDVYALGGLLAYLLSGVKPGDEGFDLALANDRVVPRELQRVIKKARAFEPSARYQTTAGLAAAVKEALPSPVVVPIDLNASYVTDVPKTKRGQSRAVVPTVTAEAPNDWVAQKAKALGNGRSNAVKRSIAELWNGWKSVDLLTKLLLILMWFFAGLFGSAFFAAGLDTSNYTRPLDAIYYPFSGILWAGCVVMFASDIQRAVVAKHAGVLPRVLPAVAKSAAKWSLIAMLGVVLMAILTGIPPILMKK